MEWTGFHRLEKDLWVTGDISRTGPLADKLDGRRQGDRGARSNDGELHAAAARQRGQGTARRGGHQQDHRRGGPLLAHRPVGLRGQRGGFQGGGRGAAPGAGRAATPALVSEWTSSSPRSRPRWPSTGVGDGWKLHTELTAAELKELSDAINGLAEPISKVAAAIADE